MFQSLSLLNPDTILGLMTQFRADPFAGKVDLGVGVFRDLAGNTPILDCVRRAERAILDAQTTKSYVGAAGREEFNTGVADLVLGCDHAARRDGRVRTLQAPGGCGALRVGAELIRAAAPSATVYVSDPTWGNHAPLLGSSGLKLQRYPYYDATRHELLFDAMMNRLEGAAPGDVVLVHACCHNPSGADLQPAQWQSLIGLLQRRALIPFLDLAYQGFGENMDADVAAVRSVADALPEVLVATSYSKNLGLYRERVGALTIIGANPARAAAAYSHLLQIARSIYSMPPDHGAAIAAHIFATPALHASWRTELSAMRDRLQDMRLLLAASLRGVTGDESFDFIESQRGMFSLLGVSPNVVARLRDRHHIYIADDSRMNLAGITPANAAYVAEAIIAARSAA